MDEISNYVHIDHISFRKEGLTPHEAATEIGLNHHWPFEKCINPLPSFYEEACGFDNIIICHHGLDQKGVAITFSGKGCSTFERESPIGWEALRKSPLRPMLIRLVSILPMTISPEFLILGNSRNCETVGGTHHFCESTVRFVPAKNRRRPHCFFWLIKE